MKGTDLCSGPWVRALDQVLATGAEGPGFQGVRVYGDYMGIVGMKMEATRMGCIGFRV